MITHIIREDARCVVDRLGRMLDPLAGSTVLITGAAGFVGSYFLDVLDAFNDSHRGRPAKVIALDSFRVGLPERVAHLMGRPWITCRAADISRPLDPPIRPDWIIHCASIGSPAIYRADPLAAVAANVQGTWNMLELTRQGAQGMLSLSTSEILPPPELQPGWRACHHESKRLGETLCATYVRMHQAPVVVVRPFNVYGPGQRLDDGRLIPDLIRAALAGGPLTLYAEDPEERRSFCYVADFVESCLTLLMMPDARGEIFAVGSPEDYSLFQCAQLVARAGGLPALPVDFHPTADGLPSRPNRPDLAPLERLTGTLPRTRLDHGLARTLASYREERDGISLRRVRTL